MGDCRTRLKQRLVQSSSRSEGEEKGLGVGLTLRAPALLFGEGVSQTLFHSKDAPCELVPRSPLQCPQKMGARILPHSFVVLLY